ncbi:ABC transporter permease [Streptomyces sp. AS58]|uniref:ABC transporter permease subunit n=1 Tax=Streptomyces cadmiisoli TaxID=2184053 RepID=A0A2Z4IW29_9ACTN|nr:MULTISPECIES: ABC transporter permease subunit [Streptomyces]AWW37030.1 ABC transporter permease subunit [Streptomyces cadmiisoli]KOV68213.1 ABC transporter permease [Streptomyces sp. AS58]
MTEFFDMPSDLQNSYLGLVGLHLREALLPVLAGLLVALPVAQLCVRLRWLYPPVLWVTTVLYAIPSLAFFVVLIDYTGMSEITVMIPLAVYSLVVFVPAIVDGVRSVPRETLDAATAMGFGPVRRYVLVQLPIAAPAIFAGLRVASVSSISLVSVGMLIGNQGALGNLLNSGMIYNQPRLVWLSVVGTAVLAVLVDAVLIGLRVLLTPWMPRGTGKTGRARTGADARPGPAALALKDAAR